MNPFIQEIRQVLNEARLRNPAIVSSSLCRPLSKAVRNFLPGAEMAQISQTNLMGRDVVLVHAGQTGWEEAIETVCQQSPGRLFVIAPQLPRAEALKLEWVADQVVVGEETYQYEVHPLGLSA